LMVEFPHQNNYFSLVVSFTITENAWQKLRQEFVIGHYNIQGESKWWRE
jgi:hypothetical protein